MCGIFAYHGITPPDPDTLTAIAAAAGRRGPHGHGWVARANGHHPAAELRLGPVTTATLTEIRAITAPLVLGHARLACFGDWQDTTQLQPAVTPGGHAIAHNGNIYNADSVYPGTATDTQALAAAYDWHRDHGFPPPQALEATVSLTNQNAWAIVAADADGRLYAHRRYHPLYVWPGDSGSIYLCSWPLAPDAAPVPENRAVTL